MTETSTDVRRVLILEADQVLTDMMAELLGRNGYSVLAVRSISEAMSCLSGCVDGIDMVIFDVDTVPLSTPGETLAKWRSWIADSVQPPACVVVSVEAASAQDLGLLSSDGDERTHTGKPTWLRKPFRNEDFLSVVRREPGGRHAGSKV